MGSVKTTGTSSSKIPGIGDIVLDGVLVVVPVAAKAAELAALVATVPGLALAANVVQGICSAVDQFRKNKAQGRILADSTLCALQDIYDALKGSSLNEVDSTLNDIIGDLVTTLNHISERLYQILDLKFLERLWKYQSIQDELLELQKECEQASNRCQRRLTVDIKRNQVKNENARRKEAELKEQRDKAFNVRFEDCEQARQEDNAVLTALLKDLQGDSERIAEVVGVIGRSMDKPSYQALQSLWGTFYTLSQPVRMFVEEATEVVQTRTNLKPKESKPWIMKRSDLIWGDRIGSGTNSVVYKGIWKEANIPVAIKEFTNPEINADDIIEEFLIWRKFRHPNLLPFLGGALFEPPFFAVSPFYSNKTLTIYIREHPQLTDDSKLLLALEIILGLAYLHTSDVVHGDLKAKNVLINNEGTAVLADFGSSRVHASIPSPQETQLSPVAGTARWLSPECLDSAPLSKASDSWALAMTLWELYVPGEVPLGNIADEDLVQTLRQDIRPPRKGGMPDISWLIMQKCWLLDPKDRLDVPWLAKALAALHPLLQNSDLEALRAFKPSWEKDERTWEPSLFVQLPEAVKILMTIAQHQLQRILLLSGGPGSAVTLEGPILQVTMIFYALWITLSHKQRDLETSTLEQILNSIDPAPEISLALRITDSAMSVAIAACKFVEELAGPSKGGFRFKMIVRNLVRSEGLKGLLNLLLMHSPSDHNCDDHPMVFSYALRAVHAILFRSNWTFESKLTETSLVSEAYKNAIELGLLPKLQSYKICKCQDYDVANTSLQLIFWASQEAPKRRIPESPQGRAQVSIVSAHLPRGRVFYRA